MPAVNGLNEVVASASTEFPALTVPVNVFTSFAFDASVTVMPTP